MNHETHQFERNGSWQQFNQLDRIARYQIVGRWKKSAEIYLLCHSSLLASVAWRRLGRFSQGHSSLIDFRISCSSIVEGFRCIFAYRSQSLHSTSRRRRWNPRWFLRSRSKKLMLREEDGGEGEGDVWTGFDSRVRILTAGFLGEVRST